MTIPTLLFAAVVGFNHAFEADHVLAVGNLANKRGSFLEAIKDGLFWGLGHTSTILAVGCVIILGKLTFDISTFAYFEVAVGVTLVALGLFRITKARTKDIPNETFPAKDTKIAYSIGLLHGLAGSGAVILIALSEIQSSSLSIIYLLLFGSGSILGMMIVAALFKIPLNSKAGISSRLQKGFVVLSGLLCVGYGAYMIFSFMN